MSVEPVSTANSPTVPARAAAALPGQAPGLDYFFVDGNALLFFFEIEGEMETLKEPDVAPMAGEDIVKGHWFPVRVKAKRPLCLLSREVVGFSGWTNFSSVTAPTQTNRIVYLVSASAAVLEPRLREVEGVVSSWAWMDEEDLVLRLYTLVDRLDYDLESRVFAAYRFVKEKLGDLASIECRVIPVQAADPEDLVPPSAQRII